MPNLLRSHNSFREGGGERETKEGSEEDEKKYTKRKEDGKQGKKEAILLFKSCENTYLLVAGVSVDTYPHTIGGADYFSSSIAKFNWRLLKTVIMPKSGDFIIKYKVHGAEEFQSAQ